MCGPESQDLDPVRDEEQARLPALRLAERAIVERRHDGLSRARGGDEQIARAPELALPGEAIQHLGLVGLRR